MALVDLTANDVLWPSRDEGRSALTEELEAASGPDSLALERTVEAILDGLGFDLDSFIRSAYEDQPAVARAIQDTATNPDLRIVVALHRHTVQWRFEPEVGPDAADVDVGPFQLQIDIEISLDDAEVTVAAGQVQASPGFGRVRTVLRAGPVTLADRSVEDVVVGFTSLERRSGGVGKATGGDSPNRTIRITLDIGARSRLDVISRALADLDLVATVALRLTILDGRLVAQPLPHVRRLMYSNPLEVLIGGLAGATIATLVSLLTTARDWRADGSRAQAEARRSSAEANKLEAEAALLTEEKRKMAAEADIAELQSGFQQILLARLASDGVLSHPEALAQAMGGDDLMPALERLAPTIIEAEAASSQ
ncbi:MAG: hypothetical protein AAGA93_16315 [Actinomycetota bacterium]